MMEKEVNLFICQGAVLGSQCDGRKVSSRVQHVTDHINPNSCQEEKIKIMVINIWTKDLAISKFSF